MPTDTQKTDILFKKSVGKVATDTAKKFFEEVNKTYNIIYSNTIWAESDLIPPTAPVLADGAVLGVVQYFEERVMSVVPGAPNSFFLSDLQDAIPFDFDINGSYAYTILDSLNQPVVFGDHDWLLDQGGGTLTFFDGIITNTPPKISFYKYIGAKGVGSGGGSALTVKEFDNIPTGTNISEILFNGADERVLIIGSQAYINPPTSPPLLGGDLIVAGTTFFLGRESQLNINYEGVAGDSHDYIITDTSFTLSINSFGNASIGNLIVEINGVDVANIDLSANFVELNREASQDMNDYDITGTGSVIVNGVVSFTGGNITLNSVNWTDPLGIDQYQDGNFTINILDGTALRQGYNTFIVKHDTGTVNSTNIFKLFYDTDVGANPLINTTDLDLNTLVSKYISGVSYCDVGTTFDLDYIGLDCFDNVYHNSNAPSVIDGTWITGENVLYTDIAITGVSTPPTIGETMTVTNKLITVLADRIETDAIINITPRDPYANYVTVQTPSLNIMINSFPASSDATTEHFNDEIYRFPITTDFNIVPAAITGNWDSTVNLLNASRTNELQVFDLYGTPNLSLIWPHDNYAAKIPIGNPNYTSLNVGTNFQYVRVFQSSIDKSNGIITINGINDADLNINIIVEVKVPSKTDWMNAFIDYNLTTFEDNVRFVNTVWAASNSYLTNQWIIPTTSNGYKYKCTTAGTTGGTEPAVWNTTVGGTTVDGTVVWTTYQIDNNEGCRINSTVHSPNLDNSIEITVGTFAVDLAVNRCLFIRITYANPAITHIINDELSIDW